MTRGPTAQLPYMPPGTDSLLAFVEAGALRAPEVQIAGVIARTVPDAGDEALLAAALCVRALQLGHVCVDLGEIAATVEVDRPRADGDEAMGNVPDGTPDPIAALPWPEPSVWASALRASPAVAERDPVSGVAAAPIDPDIIRPLVFDGRQVYLERYWRYERQIGDTLLSHADDAAGVTSVAAGAVDAVLDRYFGSDDGDEPDLQRRAAEVSLRRRVTVIAGGPGTGKTHTVARLLAAAHQLTIDAGSRLEVAMAAPTGKAAARMTDAVHQAAGRADLPAEVAGPLLATEAGTIHRLLGWVDGISFRHDAANPLPHDLVVIDETSMVDLPLMARLLDALRPDARLVLVGDPFQLASVEAGAVLGDIVGPLARGAASAAGATGPLTDNIVVLDRARRFAADSAIAALADAVRSGDAARSMQVLRDPASTEVQWIDPNDETAMRELYRVVTANAVDVVAAAMSGDAEAAMSTALELKVLCGTRYGQLGSYAWRDLIERRLRRLVGGIRTDRRWYVGRPIIITRNDYLTGVFNGDTGILVQRDGRPVVALPAAESVRELATSQLDEVETWWSMTIHKSQGSEFTHAVISLPHAESRILTNELLYTGITRGKERVTVIATEEALTTAINRPITRASGLQDRLWR